MTTQNLRGNGGTTLTTRKARGYAVSLAGSIVATYLFSARGTRAIYSLYYAESHCTALRAKGLDAELVELL
jgi:hypothetical protein